MKKIFTQSLLLATILTCGVGIGSYGLYAASAGAPPQHAKSAVKGVPGPVTDVDVSIGTPHEDGTADITMTFKAPTTYIDDYWNSQPGLDELTKIEIKEMNDSWEYVTIHTIDNPEIGATLSVTLENAAEGSHSYRIVSSNSLSTDDDYSSRYSVSAYVGYDIPGEVLNLKVENNYPNMKISWEPPTKGSRNGYIDPSKLTYTVVREVGYYYDAVDLATGITETSFEDVLDLSKMSPVRYKVYATNDVSIGVGLYTEYFIVGPALSLPFTENFVNGTEANLWTKYSDSYDLYISTSISHWGGRITPFGTLENSYDEDYGGLFMTCEGYEDNTNDSYCTYTSPAIDLSSAKRPALSFYHYVIAREDNNITTSIIIEQGGVQTTVKTFTYTEGTDGWSLQIIPLDQFVGKGDIKLIFRGDCNLSKNGFAGFDCISIDELRDYDLAIKDLEAPAKLNSGDSYTISANVTNNGEKTAEKFAVNILKDSEVYATLAGENLESGESKAFTFELKADNTYNESTTFEAEVVFDADEDTSNNRTDAITTSVKLATLPAVSDLTASYESFLKVNLEWSEPNYVLPEGEDVNEGFESYDHAALSYGDWSSLSSYTHYPIYLENKGLEYEDWQDEKFSYIVLDNTKLTVTDATLWHGKPHSGDKYLLSTSANWGSRNDYLISPELSGEEQTLEFYAASNSFPSNKYSDETVKDQIYVYASFTTDEESAFTYKALTAAGDKSSPYELQNSLADGQDYEKITVELPEGTKYFAVVIVTEGASNSIVFLDDFKFTRAQSQIRVNLLGYNVFDGENQLNSELITDTRYQDTVENDSEHHYSVQAVYNAGAAEKSGEAYIHVFDNNDGVNGLTSQGIAIRTAPGQICITAPAGTASSVADYSGRVIALNNGSANLNVAPGAYIVKAGNKVAKVFVK